MIKKCFKVFTAGLAVMMVFLCFQGCSFDKSNKGYVTAKSGNTFSTLNGMVAWTKEHRFFIEKDGVVKSHLDYDMGMGDPYFSNPTLIGDYLYYVGGYGFPSEKGEYVARINHTKEKPNVEKLTESKRVIYSYAVVGNKLYYCGTEKSDITNKLFVKNLFGKKEKVLIEGAEASSDFTTNGDKIITESTVFDIKSKTSKVLLGTWAGVVGTADNYYYFFSETDIKGNFDNDFKRMNLDDNSIETLFTRRGYGWDSFPKLYDNKILFLDGPSGGTRALKYEYYDVLKGEMVTAMDSTDEQSRYTHDILYAFEQGERHDFMIHGNYFYVNYPDRMTRVNMNTKEEEVFVWGANEALDGQRIGYKWYSYEGYVQRFESQEQFWAEREE